MLPCTGRQSVAKNSASVALPHASCWRARQKPRGLAGPPASLPREPRRVEGNSALLAHLLQDWAPRGRLLIARWPPRSVTIR